MWSWITDYENYAGHNDAYFYRCYMLWGETTIMLFVHAFMTPMCNVDEWLNGCMKDARCC